MMGWAASLLAALCWLLAVPVTLAVGVLALQVLGFRRASSDHALSAAANKISAASFAIVVPAHNEATGIAVALQSMLPQLGAQGRLLVVADNCTDDTATIARQAGAEVVERTNAQERGKGFALAHGVAHLAQQPPEMVVILDADCQLAPGALAALLDCAAQHNRPAQALYLMEAPAGAGLGARLAEFAWRVRNWVRPAGGQHWGMPCQLMGTGMAFSWDMLRTASLANASIVEDMKLGIELAAQGRPPRLCATALVTSAFPATGAATKSQRTRWEHGHLEMIVREAPGMVWQAFIRRDAGLVGMAADLAVPPLALLAGLLCAGWGGALVLWWWAGQTALLQWYSLLGALLTWAVLHAWARVGRGLVRLSELASIPWYIAAKLPIYLGFVVKRQKEWVRTERDSKDRTP